MHHIGEFFLSFFFFEKSKKKIVLKKKKSDRYKQLGFRFFLFHTMTLWGVLIMYDILVTASTPVGLFLFFFVVLNSLLQKINFFFSKKIDMLMLMIDGREISSLMEVISLIFFSHILSFFSNKKKCSRCFQQLWRFDNDLWTKLRFLPCHPSPQVFFFLFFF